MGNNVVITGVAAMPLVFNLDEIDRAVNAGTSKRMKWSGAFALMVTLVWLYVELLLLLARRD
ncbi:MAG: Bax inhibitor-1/YccA family protein [Gemmatimonadota bacterium]